ncbi:hypothetical protein ACJRO7_020338 [Eucalyptus globulus]|uniref:Uncharacterized protein n=1 Tax=Eucalyptus globulus TaxID=34317 RepID=A0ABD3KMG0_EUCGL
MATEEEGGAGGRAAPAGIGIGIGTGIGSHWWWAMGGAAQLGLGISSCLKGYGGGPGLMPLKAAAVASLFVGATACASVAALHASGIRKVEDLIEIGANIRTNLGNPPVARVNERKSDNQ